MNAKDSRGQAAVLTVVFMTVLLGASALAIDVGSWFKARRTLQAQVDAAALAGAQALPGDTARAQGLAIEYASTNGTSLSPSGITFSTAYTADDTISVQMKAPAPGFFSKLFGLSSVTVEAHAAARTGDFDEARYVSPIGVDYSHPDLSGDGCPCFGDPTVLTMDKIGPGGFKLLNIDGSHGGTNPHTLAGWMDHGLDAWMPLGDYYSDPGAKFNDSGMKSALDDNTGKELLFPVYDDTDSGGAGLFYHVIGWVGFHLTGYTVHGSGGTVEGWFTEVIWQGIQAHTGDDSVDFGARSVQLVN